MVTGAHRGLLGFGDGDDATAAGHDLLELRLVEVNVDGYRVLAESDGLADADRVNHQLVRAHGQAGHGEAAVRAGRRLGAGDDVTGAPHPESDPDTGEGCIAGGRVEAAVPVLVQKHEPGKRAGTRHLEERRGLVRAGRRTKREEGGHEAGEKSRLLVTVRSLGCGFPLPVLIAAPRLLDRAP